MTLPDIIQILDSRGNPTLQASYTLPNGRTVTAKVPSGASTGKHEAIELRDGGEQYQGRSVLNAIDNANTLARDLLWEPAHARTADTILIDRDGTRNKARYGANAILALSMLQARLEAAQKNRPLYALLAAEHDLSPALPIPFSNVINGGRHAGNGLQLQEFMIVPVTAQSFYDATRQVAETTHALKGLIAERYGPSQTAVGDEGGFAPDIDTAQEACELLLEAMQRSGHRMAIAIDAAASEFYDDGTYRISEDETLDPEQLRERYVELIERYPIISLEDPFDEDAFGDFAQLRERIKAEGLTCQIVGDDLTVTNIERIERAIQEGSCDSLLLKVNQIGTVTESIRAARLAMSAGWTVMVSHRSGETTDDFIADLATAIGCGQAKIGAPVRGERTAKYNRLLELEYRHGLAVRHTVHF